jgi:hypothetical protein
MAIIILIIGVGVWSIFGTLETKESVVVSVNSGVGQFYLTYDQLERVSTGMTVRVGECEGTVMNIESTPINVNDEWYYNADVSIDVADGVYASEIVTDSVSPVYFLFD